MPMRPLGALLLLFVLATVEGCCNWEPCPRTKPPRPCPPRYADEGADVVIIGNIRTLDPKRPMATGMVIRGGVVQRLTSADDAVRYASSTTRLVNVPYGGVALPGFIDSHAHLRSIGRALREIDLRGAATAAEAATKVGEAAKSAPQGTWILGRGWNQENWGGEWPNRLMLDEAAPGCPVALTRVDGHALWVSSRALELAQIGRSSIDPSGGEIMRDNAGEPTGILVDNAMEAVDKLIAATSTDDEARADFLRAQEEAFKYGITTLVDAGETPEKLLVLSQLYEQGQMKLRVYAMVGVANGAELDATLARPPAPSLFGDRLAVRAIKLYADGALGSRGAWLLAPYADRPGHYGLPVSDPTFIKAAVRGCLDRGYQLCVHAIGDRATRTILDAIQDELDKTPRGDHRFRIEHAQCVDPRDLDKFRTNGVIPSIQPCHATSDAAWAAERLGHERLYAIGYQHKSMLEHWLHPAMGTDAPVEPLSPVENYYAAITRRDPAGRLATPFMPEQRMNGKEALLAMTRYGAEAAFCEDRRGMLSPGFQADVVVLDRDIASCNTDLIPTTGVCTTIVGGEVVWQKVGPSRVISDVDPGNLPGR